MNKLLIFTIIVSAVFIGGCDKDISGQSTDRPVENKDISVILTPDATTDIGSYTIRYNIKNVGNSSSVAISPVITITYLDGYEAIDGLDASVAPIGETVYPVGSDVGEVAFCTFNKYGTWKIRIEIIDQSVTSNNSSEFQITVRDPNSDANDSVLGQWHMWIQYNNNTPPAIEYWDFNIEYNNQYRLVTTGHDWFEYYVITDGSYFNIVRTGDFGIVFTGIINESNGTITGRHTGYPDSEFVMTRPAG